MPLLTLREGSAWLAAAAVAIVAVALSGYTSRDPDSRAYAAISAELARRPPAEWIAPEWWGAWEREGLFREHPNGFFVLPALLAKTGYPPLQAVYAVNVFYQIASLLLLATLAGVFVQPRDARVLLWTCQLLPISFVFRARANHEWALLFWLLVALYAVERSRESARWGIVAVVGLIAATAVKGVFGLFGVMVCGMWLLARGISVAPVRSLDGAVETSRAWIWLAIATVAVAGAIVAYEAAYRRLTGDSFVGYYMTHRLASSGAFDAGVAHLGRFAANLAWYAGRLLWFAFPWSLVVLAWTLQSMYGRLWQTPLHTLPPVSVDGRAGRGVLFAALLSFAYLLVLSWPATRADRFIFPAYFAVGALGTLLPARTRRGGRVVMALESYSFYGPAVLWLVLFLSRIATGRSAPWLQFR